jgi:hypothetical protein
MWDPAQYLADRPDWLVEPTEMTGEPTNTP